MKKYLFSIIFVFMGILPLFPQNIVTLDVAIEDYAIGLMNNVQKDRGVAVIAFETDKRDLAEYFIDTMTEKLWEKGIRPIFERQRLEVLQRELNYSLSGDVSDETALRIGQRTGVNTVVYGTLRLIGNGNYRISIRATNVETAQLVFPKSYDLQMDSRLAGLLGISETAWADDVRRRAEEFNRQTQPDTSNQNQSTQQQPVPPKQPREPINIETKPIANFFAGIGGGNFVGAVIPEAGLQAGIGVNSFNFLVDVSGGMGIDVAEKIDYEMGFIYNLGGLIEYRFADVTALGLGGGWGGLSGEYNGDHSYPYIRGSISILFLEGHTKVGLNFDYNFDYGFKIGLRFHVDLTDFNW